ncbi:MAG: PIN domain-containing protein [Rectinemataceae bacterium]
MILVDTSVWIDHLRQSNQQLVELLEVDEVLAHPWVMGELALGSINDRKTFLSMLGYLPKLAQASDAAILAFIESRKLAARGIGWVDAGLLAACAARPCRIFTLDKKLNSLAEEIGLGFASHPGITHDAYHAAHISNMGIPGTRKA